jgi:hypothetical protein
MNQSVRLAEMKKLLALLIGAGLLSYAASDDASTPATAVQRLFDAMSTRNVDAARALFTPEATLIAVRADGTAAVTPHEQWLNHLAASKDQWLERMWNPKTLEHGSIAVVWAEYDFHLNGKFSHCGVDSVDLLKTPTGWKISGVSFTRETTACAPSPLGPPAKQ